MVDKWNLKIQTLPRLISSFSKYGKDKDASIRNMLFSCLVGVFINALVFIATRMRKQLLFLLIIANYSVIKAIMMIASTSATQLYVYWERDCWHWNESQLDLLSSTCQSHLANQNRSNRCDRIHLPTQIAHFNNYIFCQLANDYNQHYLAGDPTIDYTHV